MKKLLAPIALLLLLAGSCKKNDTTSIPTTTNNFKTYGSIDEIFSLLSLQPKVVNVDATTGATFYGNSGTRYVFQPNCFVDAAGATVTGNVQVAVTEYLKKGDMIFGKLLPISDGDRLVSGGEICVKATKGGSEVFMKPGMTFQAGIPQFGSTDTSMSLFRGDASASTSTNNVNWQLTKDTVAYTARYAKYYKDTLSLICDSFQFWNGDHFIGNTNNQDFKVSVVATGASVSSASILNTYALFDKENSLMDLYGGTNGVYGVNYLPDEAVHFVSFGLINGHFYGGVAPATPKTGQTYTITLTEVDPAAFKAQINGLY